MMAEMSLPRPVSSLARDRWLEFYHLSFVTVFTQAELGDACAVSDDLRRRWKREYLESLRCWRHPGGRPARLPKVGEVVLVGGVEPRGRWPGPGADPGAERRLSCGFCGDTRGTYPPTDCEIIPAGSFARLDVSDHYRPD